MKTLKFGVEYIQVRHNKDYKSSIQGVNMITTTVIIIWVIYFFFLYFTVFWLLIFVDTPLSSKSKKIKNYPLVSIGIPAYNEEKTIAKTIESAVLLDYPKNKIEIIVVNDGSIDKTAQVVRKMISKYKNMKVILINQKNGGKGKALNVAIKKSRGEYFVSLDADSFVRSDALKKILPHFTDDDVAAVLPLMKIKKPKKILEKIQWAEYMVNLFYKRLMAILDCVQVTPGPFSVYKKDILVKVGGYDENNLTEDMEVTLKLQKIHYKIKQINDTEVYTIPPKTLKAFFKQRNRWYKGTLINAYSYKNMIFNKQYGDFGMIQMPRLLAEGFLAVSAFFIIGYISIVRPLWFKFHNYALVNFDILPLFSRWFSNFSLLDLDYMNLFLAFAMTAIVIFFMYHAHKQTRQRFSINSIVSIPLYLIFYSILASLALLTVFADLIRGKRQKW